MIPRFFIKYFLLLIIFSFTNKVFSGTTPFVTTWKTNNSSEITIWLASPGGFDYTVDWGDGTVTNHQETSATHFYNTRGIYTISITGIFPFFICNESTGEIISIEQWGDNAWITMDSMFAECGNLQYNATDTPNLSNVEIMDYMFAYTKVSNLNVSNWDVSNVVDMAYMFSGNEFNGDIGINNWDVSNVSNISGMFDGAIFNQGVDLSSWDVSNMTNISNIFANVVFNQDIGINNWNLNKITNMSGMFDGAVFNQVVDLSSWDVSNVTNISGMFASVVFNQDIGISNWDLNKITDMSGVFYSTVFNLDIGISNWDVSNVTNMSRMFDNAFFNHDVDISNWDVSNVTNMSGMFFLSDFNQDISNWDVGNVVEMEEMFSHTRFFNQDISNWDVSNVTNMNSMFYLARFFNQDISSWDVGNVTDMGLMFYNAEFFNQDISNWNVSQVTNMTNMLSGVRLSVDNYDSLLNKWSTLNLRPNVRFSGGLSQYCNGVNAKTSIIENNDWIITDGGPNGAIIDDIENQKVLTSFNLPAITGVNLSGQERFFTEPNGNGSVYNSGDIIHYDDFSSYPITLYIYDPICSSQQDFELIIEFIPSCSNLSSPIQGALDVSIETDLIWDLVASAKGYKLSIGTDPNTNDILDAVDIGNVLSYNIANYLPEDTQIYVNITPYNDIGDALDCSYSTFTTESIPKPIIPAFFTPNNDTRNDTWVVQDPLNELSSISIYNRYGKLLKQINDFYKGWDGTYLNRPLPTNDYWYLITYKSGETLKGHFSLVR